MSFSCAKFACLCSPHGTRSLSTCIPLHSVSSSFPAPPFLSYSYLVISSCSRYMLFSFRDWSSLFSELCLFVWYFTLLSFSLLAFRFLTRMNLLERKERPGVQTRDLPITSRACYHYTTQSFSWRNHQLQQNLLYMY